MVQGQMFAEVVEQGITPFDQNGIASSSLAFRSINSAQANAMLSEHYLGAVTPARVLASYTDGEAVALYGRPTRGNVRFGYQATELMRLWSPDEYNGTLSQFLSMTVRAIKRDFPDVQILVAYAAPEAGHHGGIYRASNWIYTGKARQGGPQALIIDGVTVHARTVNHRYGHSNQKRLREEGHTVEAIARVPKHTYYYPLNRRARRDLLLEANQNDPTN